MSTYDDVHAAAVAALATTADQLPPALPKQRVDPADTLVVRSSDLDRLLRCPTAAALDGDEPFVEQAATVGWSAAATVLDRLVHGHVDPRRGDPPTDPHTGYRLALGEVDQLDWPWGWIDAASRPEKAVVAAEVHRRVAATARMAAAGSWPPTGTGAIGVRTRWLFPQRPLHLRGRVDLVDGVRRTGAHTLVVVLAGDHGPTTRTRLAFEALVETLDQRRPPATVLGVLPDAGRRWPLAVDDAMLAEGVAAAALAARTVLARRSRTPSADLPRTPGTRCHHCAHGSGCEPGTTWLAGPGRLRSGFLPPASASSGGLP